MRLRALVALPASALLLTALPATAAAPTVTTDRVPVATLSTDGTYDSIEDFAVGDDGRTYVLDGDEVGVYAAGASGSAPTTRTIAVPVVVDQVPRLVTVDDDGYVTVMSAEVGYQETTFHVFDTFGMVVGTFTDTELGLDQAIAIDAVGDQVAVVDNNTNGVDVFDLRSGTTTPTRSIPGGLTTKLVQPVGVAGTADGRLAVTGVNNYPSGAQVWVAVFSATATGEVAPQRYVEGTRTRMGTYPSDIAMDAAGGVYVAGLVFDATPGEPRVVRFAPTARGNVAPLAVLQGPRAGLGTASGLDLGLRGTVVTTPYSYTNSEFGVVGSDVIRTHRRLGPYAKPGQPRALKLTGTGKKRTLTWKPALTDPDTPVRNYLVSVTCSKGGTGGGYGKSLGGAKRKIVVKLTPGKCTVELRALSAVGISKPAKIRRTVKN